LIAMNATLTALTALIKKDLVLYFSNRRALVMSIAAPIVIAAFFGAIFGSGGEKPTRVPIAVVDADASALTKAVASRRSRATDLRGARAARGRRGRAGAEGQGARRDRPARGLRREDARRRCWAAARRRRRRSTTTRRRRPRCRWCAACLTQHVLKAIGETMGGRRAAGRRRARSARRTSARRSPRTSAADRPYNGYAHSFAGMGVQFILFMGIEVGVGVLLARRSGLWKRLRAAPLSRATLLGSHILSGALTALILLAIIYAAAIGIFRCASTAACRLRRHRRSRSPCSPRASAS
jgi:ABC-2 type transport system permease protein